MKSKIKPEDFPIYKEKLKNQMIDGLLYYVRDGIHPQYDRRSFLDCYNIVQKLGNNDETSELLFKYHDEVIEQAANECYEKTKDLLVKHIEDKKKLEEQVEKLENLALQYQRYARISFKVIAIDEKDKLLFLSVRQGKSPHENYAEATELMIKGKELFAPFFVGYTIRVSPEPYQNSPVEIVNPEWVQKNMNKYKVGNKQMVEDFGISKAEISAMVNGHTVMSQRSKAMFYYYFKTKELENQK